MEKVEADGQRATLRAAVMAHVGVVDRGAGTGHEHGQLAFPAGCKQLQHHAGQLGGPLAGAPNSQGSVCLSGRACSACVL